MWSYKLNPRFSETDALGHINNTVHPVWFEEGRTPIFELFCPKMDLNDWYIIIAKIDVEFLAETHYGQEVEIRTSIKKLGNTSMTVNHEAWQAGGMVARGTAVVIHFDHKEKVSKPIPDDIRAILEQHLKED